MKVEPDEHGKAKFMVGKALTREQETAVSQQMPTKHKGWFDKELTKSKTVNQHKTLPAQRGEEIVVQREMAQVQDEFALIGSDLLS